MEHKKNRIHRMLALFMAFMMVFTMIPTSAFAAESKAAKEADYELRILTFEDEDYKGDQPDYWSSLVDDPQYGGELLYGSSGTGVTSEEEAYKWTDAGNTELTHTMVKGMNWFGSGDTWCYWNGGHAVSNYVSGDEETYGDFMSQLTVYKEGVSGLETSGGGHNGSDNFVVHDGYMDDSGYNMTEALPAISFADGIARVIDHMYVNSTCYFLNCCVNGNGLTTAIGDGDWVKLVATGYHEDGTTSQVTFSLCDGPENIVKDWTKWDLSELGEVTKVDFNVTGSVDNGYGLSIPAYFAYDDIAVRFEKEEEEIGEHFTVTAPEGSVVSAGTLSTYYIYQFAEPLSVKTENGKVIYQFAPLKGTSFIRVQRPDDPDAVTYWDYTTLSDGTTIDVTEDMLFMNDEHSFDADTIYHDFEEYAMDVANVYVNGNEKGYLNLEQDDTYELNIVRNWMAIESFSNSKVALPDVSYQVIDFDGNESDVLTVTPDENNSSVAEIKANKEGTAIVLVTYDAMYHTLAAQSALGYGSAPEKFSAIWPENTGVLVVSVGEEEPSIETNMTINEGKNADTVISKLVGDKLDAEHDELYYVGNDGAEYTFIPEKGCSVSVARAELTENSLTYHGFTTEGISTDAETGAVTVTGLTSGRHIIRVEKDGQTDYQVITAKKTEYTVIDPEGNVITKDSIVEPGTTLTVQFGDLYNPINKLSGIYNTNCRIYYAGEDGTEFVGENGSNFGYYTFASDKNLHKFTITIPENWEEDTYTLNGCLKTGGFGDSAGRHRGLTYAAGKPVNTTANATAAYLGALPELTFRLKEEHIHDYGTEWKTDDTQHWKECECGEKSELADHSFTWVVDKAATTEDTGLKHEECICGVTRNEDTEIPKVATVDVYFSVSEDADFFASEDTGEVMAMREMTVPYFDLANYDLESFSSGEENEITMLHLFIYATEVYYCGIDAEDAGQGYLKEENLLGSDVLDITGSYGSMFMNMFWNMDLNLNYYLNNEYPLEYNGWGATADKILLHDGDIVTLGHFTSWSFFNDPTSIFNYIQRGEDAITTTAEQGDQVTLTLYHAGPDYTGNYTTAHTPIDYCPDVYYISVDELNDAGGDVTEWNAIGTADSEGNIIFDTSDLEAGTYLVAVAGQYGSEITDDICSTPGGILLTITEKEYVQPDMTLLNAAIAEADGLTAENYTEESWAVFAEALEAAKEIAASETVDQDAVDAALAALTAAKEALAEKEAEKEPADAADDSKDVPVEMYITSAGSTQTGGSTGSAIDGDYSTFWEVAWDIGATNPELLWYQIELEEAVELEALRYYPRSGSNQGSSNGFITDYQVLVSNDGEEWTVVSEGSWEMTTEWKIAEFDSPVTAKYVRLFATGTYADVGNNTNMSIAEIRVKSVEKVDYVPAVKKDALEAAINKAEALKAADYVDFTAVEEALAAAKAVYANEEAAQEEVDAAAATLNAAVKALVKAATAEERAALKEAIDKAKALNAADYVDFTAVEEALTAAEEVYANEKASQSEVKAATNKLNKAIKALVEVVVEENEVVRLAGKDRYQTGIVVAEELKAVLGVEKFESVIIATGKNYADALSGSYLAAVKNAPILLTNGKAANVAELHAYIKENVAVGGTVYILGGTAAVPENVEAIKEAGYKVERISGSSRYETSLKILEAAGINGEELIVATGNNFADSLSASAAGRPIMLVKPNTALTDAQKAVVSKFTQIYVVGGEGVVSKAIETELAAYGTVTRLSGTDRYETSVKVAETFFKDADKALIANGKKFPDGLCGGALAAALGAPLLLTKDGNTTAAAEYVSSQGIGSGYVLGGTGAISEETVEAIFGFAETK